MCVDPVTLGYITLAISGASAYAQHQTAEGAADAQEAQNKLEANIIKQSESLEQMDLARQRQQEYEAASAEVNSYGAQARKDQGELDALLGEGFAGNSGNRRLTTLGISQGQDLATLASNATKVQSELGFASSARSNARNQRLASIRTPDRPSKWGTALTIAGYGVQAYGLNREHRVGERTEQLWREINTGPPSPAGSPRRTYREVSEYVRKNTF